MHFKRIKSYGYIDRIVTIDELISESTRDLFNKMCVPSHCLNHLLPDYRVCVIICGCVVMGFNCLLIVLFYIETHLLLVHCTCMLNSLMCVCRIF